MLVVLGPGVALAYRPFVSTDAAVTAPGDVEVEFGCIGFRRQHGDATLVAPTVVATVGLLRDLQLSTETKVTHDLASRGAGWQAEDTVVSVKWVAREGALQDVSRMPSLAAELSLLVPTAKDEHQVGGELIGLVSGTAFGWTYHLNGGPLVDTIDGQPGAIWGVIVEHALHGRLRAVAEVNGETVSGGGPDNSALVGAIWEIDAPAPLRELSLDAGVRRGLSSAAADWGGTAGFTVAFPW